MTGLYVHIPFCASKCAYCDFNSVVETGLVPAYLDALKREARFIGERRKGAADTVFFGGGTPGLLEPGDFLSLMKCLSESFDITPEAEITLETNPCAVTEEKLDAYLKAGVNRLSMGLQAAQDALLNVLGRGHTVRGFDAAYNAARAAGFNNINIDAIYGVPNQSHEDWEETLYHILYLKPEHISAYALKLENGTLMAEKITQGSLPEIDDDTAAEQYIAGRRLLTRMGYTNYEISNFSKTGAECAHNLKYWTLQDYIGLGAGAHSGVGNMRYANFSDIEKYIARIDTGAPGYESGEYIQPRERVKEALMLMTRLKTGVNAAEFEERFGVDIFKEIPQNIEKAEKAALIEVTKSGFAPTEKGFLFQNKLALTLTDI